MWLNRRKAFFRHCSPRSISFKDTVIVRNFYPKKFHPWCKSKKLSKDLPPTWWGFNLHMITSDQGGLAARSGTEFTWSPQLRNLAEWDWVPIFLQHKYGGECGHGKMMSFSSVLRFTASKHQEKVFMNFFHEMFGHQEAWCMNSSWVTSLIVIRHLGKFSYL